MCNVAVPGRTVALGRNGEGWAGTGKVGGRASTLYGATGLCSAEQDLTRQGEHAAGGLLGNNVDALGHTLSTHRQCPFLHRLT